MRLTRSIPNITKADPAVLKMKKGADRCGRASIIFQPADYASARFWRFNGTADSEKYNPNLGPSLGNESVGGGLSLQVRILID